MPTEPSPPSLAEVVKRAVDVVDPEGADDGAAELLRRLEDEDEPVTAVADVEERLAETAGALDPQQEDPVVQMVAATATYLAFRRDELDEDPLVLLLHESTRTARPPARQSTSVSAVDAVAALS